MLLQAGLQIELPDNEGRSLVHWAAISEPGTGERGEAAASPTAVLELLLQAWAGSEHLPALLAQQDVHGAPFRELRCFVIIMGFY